MKNILSNFENRTHIKDLYEQNRIDEGGFTRSGHARNADEASQGDLHVDLFQIVHLGAVHTEEFTVARPAGFRHVDPPPSRKERAGDGIFALRHLRRRTGKNHLAAVDAGTWADIHDVVGGGHSFLVVLHHENGVAQIPQVLQRGDQPAVVPLMETDGGLVQHVHHAGEGGADLGGQTDTLCLTAGKRSRTAGQGQIIQAHVDKESKAGAKLLHNFPGNHLLGGSEGQGVQERQSVGDGKIAQ